ncbi:hypothetical protein ACUIJ1_15515 [Acinetobacter junii]|uniref:hypothetical protein n=1 Tax=Acinetobacter junii TaxID=40215 RepID=UPI00403D819E
MTELEQAKLATDLLNALSPMFIYVFISGVVFGVFFFGRLIDAIDRLGYRLRRPKRIRFRNLNGRHERGDSYQYLYLFKGEYYTLEQRDFLLNERLKNYRQRIKKQESNA